MTKNANMHRNFALLLIDDFALMSYAALIEPFRAANILSGQDLYRWCHVSVDGAPVRASSGATLSAEAKVGDAVVCDTVFVVAGGDPTHFADAATFGWLRRLARDDVRIGGISGGPFVLARAGVLAGYRATIHWEHRAALLDQFPDMAVDPGLYVIDRRRITCAGGTAAMDLAIEMIARDHGPALAGRVSEWFIRTDARAADRPQRLGISERYRVQDDRLVRALAMMEENIEEPLAVPLLARRAGVSLRQLQRLFVAEVGADIRTIYMRIRLDHAEALLRQTGMTVTQVALATGFGGSAQFSRAFSRHFGVAPSRWRDQPSLSRSMSAPTADSFSSSRS